MELNWLITGGCGFIGTSLIRRLLADGSAHIRVVDNLSVGERSDLEQLDVRVLDKRAAELREGPVGEAVELVVADVRDRESMRAVGKGIDVIVHLAANTGVGPSVEDPVTDCEVNVLGTLAALESARENGAKRFVFASSGAPLGEVEPPIHERLAPRPVSPYGASKLAGEGYCSAYAKCFGVETVALRFGNVYGPGSGRKQSVVAKFIGLALCGEPVEIYGDGGQTRDFVFIDDLIEAIDRAASVEGIGGEIFQIATSRETTVSEIFELLTAALAEVGVSAPEVIHSGERLGDMRRNFSDTTKAREMLDWSAKTALDIGLKATVVDFVGKIRKKTEQTEKNA